MKFKKGQVVKYRHSFYEYRDLGQSVGHNEKVVYLQATVMGYDMNGHVVLEPKHPLLMYMQEEYIEADVIGEVQEIMKDV